MKFSTRSDRREVLDRLDANPISATYGDAMAHAASAQLGFFGDREALRRDCAMLMLAEVRKLLAERNVQLEVVLNDVLCARSFRLHYDHARHPMEDEVEAMVGKSLPPVPRPPSGPAHVAVADEIVDRLHTAEYWSQTARARKEW